MMFFMPSAIDNADGNNYCAIDRIIEKEPVQKKTYRDGSCKSQHFHSNPEGSF